jgi:predicted alpha/beta-fold hydrolase
VSFQPLPLLGSPHLQTVLANTFSLVWEPRSARQLIDLPDGDRLALEVSTPVGWRRTDPTVVIVHGLGGSHRSTYAVRLARKLFQRGVRAVRLNLRGQGSGVGLSRKPYHAGCSEDVRAAVEVLKREEPRSRITLAGFSLGGNICVKLAGELGRDGGDLLESVVAVCPALDLLRCSQRIDLPENLLYQRMFMRELRAAVTTRERAFPDLPPANLPHGISVRGFDDAYIAPRVGYRDAAEYYEATSALHLVSRTQLPLRMLFADDDPLVDREIAEKVRPPARGELLRTPRGGHLGFLGRAGGHGVRWMDRVVLDWIAA